MAEEWQTASKERIDMLESEVHMYIYIYMYTYTYTHTHNGGGTADHLERTYRRV